MVKEVKSQYPTVEWGHRLALIGQYPGVDEMALKKPFEGPAGHILNECLYKSGLNRKMVFLSNALRKMPPEGDLQNWAVKKADLPSDTLPPFDKPIPGGGYLAPPQWPQVQALFDELFDFKPDLIIPMGGLALWALTGRTDIQSARGTLAESLWGPLIPTFCPASCLQGAYSNRVVIRADFEKALRWLDDPEAFNKERIIHVTETLEDVRQVSELFLGETSPVACDIETTQGIIDCIGFAATPFEAYVIPFAKTARKGKTQVKVLAGPYWPDSWTFRQVWREVKKILEQGGGERCPMDLLMDRLPDPSKAIQYMEKRLYG